MKPIDRPMPPIAYIVARSSPGGVIGCENNLPWRLKTDMKFFRSVTEGNVVIMGRKTFESLGRPLPNRTNIVLSNKPGRDLENLIWVRTPEMALFLADFFSIIKDRRQIIVMGGAQIYELFDKLFTKIYLTEVFHDFKNGDAFFKNKFDMREWSVIGRKNYVASDVDQYDFQISVLERKLKYTRNRDISEFYSQSNTDIIGKNLPNFTEKLRKPGGIYEEQFPLPLPQLVAC
ncbi:dihydrofolate reductase [Methylobacterium sp. E-045]|uniref:dihydrofolate reductase n=1 Tax=Methylobacterium sp. E-045 TaxID=2836575 RepID=UPI001FB96948|nr:dihydrofolate reductase [Methylobacterium sp. E-045]MCJ2128483.1 dihydrofolate reductase [Methylobacterium sp. E-045]